MPLLASRDGRASPATALALLLIGAGVVGVLRQRLPDNATTCPDAAGCPPPTTTTPAGAVSPSQALPAGEVCRNVGYLCAGLTDAERIVVQRWRDKDGPMVVHVPLPDITDRGVARSLQRAAVAGVRLWNGQPFPVVVDERGNRTPDVRVRWTPSLGGVQLGVTRTEWSSGSGLRVRGIDLVTTNPRSGRPVDPAQIRLTAAHEMGHALGLPHSDQPRDVMFATNTATALSARDYRTLEALYALADGAVIVR